MIRNIATVYVITTILFVFASCQETPKELAIMPNIPVKTIYIGQSNYYRCSGKNFSDTELGLLTNMKWLKNGVEILNDESASMYVNVESTGVLELIIAQTQPEHAGEYVCEATFAGNVQLRATQTLTVYKDITFVECDTEQQLVLGREGTIGCTVEANPQADTKWKIVNNKKAQRIKSDDYYSVTNNGLVIKNVTKQDEKTYTLEAKVTITGKFQIRRFNVKVIVPPIILHPPKDTLATQEKEARIACIAKGEPKPKITWFHQPPGKEITAISGGSDKYTIDEEKNELVLNSVQKNQEGIYVCEASNDAGKATAEAQVTVIIMPKIQRFTNKTVNERNVAILECFTTGDPAPAITITKDASEQPIDKSRIQAETGPAEENGWTFHKITISNVSRADDGLYSCRAENDGGTSELKGHLTVQYAPIMDQTPSREVITWQDNPVNITCHAQAIPNATIEWWFRNRIINPDETFQIYNPAPGISRLGIKQPRQDLYESYVCRAKNIIGQTDIKIKLKEVYKPGRILQVMMPTITATTLTIKIVEPDNVGGAAVTGYICQYKEQGAQEWMTKKWPAIPESFILDNLEPTKTYEFRFAAQNVVGIGEFIDVDPVTLPERSPPEAPGILKSQETKVMYSPYPQRFTVKWSVPADNGEQIRYFEINYYKVRNSSGTWTKSSDFNRIQVSHDGVNHHELNNLQPETFYKLELRAANDLGNSPDSSVIFRTAKDDGTAAGVKSATNKQEDAPQLQPAAIVGIIVGILVIVLIIVDVSFCLMNKCGVTFTICNKLRSDPKSDDKFIDDAKASEKAKENEGLDMNNVEQPEKKIPKDSAV